MKRIIALLLGVLMLISASACAAEPLVDNTLEGTSEDLTVTAEAVTQEETTEEAVTIEYPQIYNSVTWEQINSFPIANPSMSIDEVRKLCVDFFRFSKTFTWTPSEDYHFAKNAKGTRDTVNAGFVYGGLPYVGLGSGNVYRTMDYINEETGVLDIAAAGEDRFLFGNQCSIGAYWGWGRAINSADYDWSWNMVQRKGFLRVGPYTYDDAVYTLGPDLTTKKICADNGVQTMYASYAALKPADGLVYYTSAGHVIMCSSTPEVKYNDDGTIDGEASFITRIDQGQTWKDYDQGNGEMFSAKAGIDVKVSFKDLYEDHYIPFTFAEFLGTDPVEDTECLFSFSDSKITITKLKQVVITANYGISDVYVNILNKEGETLLSCPIRMTSANVRRLTIDDGITDEELMPYAVGQYTVNVVLQMANGARPTVYSGILTN